MNSPFMVRQAEHLARRIAEESTDAPTSVVKLYLRLWARLPSEAESELGCRYLEGSEESRMARLRAYCQVLLASSEMLFLD